jgi:DNA polymerase-1
VPDVKRKLFLLDGNSLAFRAFFALPDSFVDSNGMPTNALFGLASMYLKVLDENEHPAVAVVWDAGMSGREQIFAEYKGTRDETPAPFKEQSKHFRPLSEAFGFQNIHVDGYEADDVIASIAERAHEAGLETVIVTGDRDSFQLARPGVTIMATTRGVTDTKLYDPEAVKERYGIGPELVPDFYGLKGDSSDNIPGVPGIGEKTASLLLQEFGSLEGVLANIEKISGPKRKENLTNHADDARMSRDLAMLKRDIEIPDLDFETLLNERIDPERLRNCLREYDLREPLRRFEKAVADWSPEMIASGSRAAPASTQEAEHTAKEGTVAPAPEAHVKVAQIAPAGLAALLKGETVALVSVLDGGGDIGEQTLMDDAGGDDPPEYGFAVLGPGGTVHVGTSADPDAIFGAFTGAKLITHDLKEQLTGTRSSVPALLHDTQIAAYLIDSSRRQYDLREMAVEFDIALPAAAAPDGADARLAELARTCAVIEPLAQWQAQQCEQLGLTDLLQDVELPLVEVLVGIEREGLRLDTDKLAAAAKGFNTEIDTLEQEIYGLAGHEFTIGSPKQLGVVLFEELGLTRGRKGKTGFSTDARVLAALREEHEIVEKIERWRELTKLRSTYVETLPKLVDPRDGRIHTTLQQTRTATGRLSSINPNLQNIPVRTPLGATIRECFVPDDGCVFVSADYSQVELRVLAYMSGDQVMQDIFRRGEDVHRATAAEIFGVPLDDVDSHLRDRAKAVNFGIIYGLSAFGLSDRLKIPRDEAADFIKRYLGRFEAVEQFMSATKEQGKADGFVTTAFGRRRAIPEINSSQVQTRNLGERLAVNTVLQGTAADIIKVAMIKCADALGRERLQTRIVMQIHDELLFEGPPDEAEAVAALARREMEGAFEMDPPLVVDVGSGPNWLATK